MIREIDDLQLYFGDDYYVNDNIIIRQPTIGEIVKMGEKKYYSMIMTLTAIPSDMKAQLYDMKIDYEAISDFELFILLRKTLKAEDTQILLKDIDLASFEVGASLDNGETVLVDKENNILIDKVIYQIMVDYIRTMHGLKVKVERAGNAHTKQVLIEESRQKLKQLSNTSYKSTLLPLVSSMVNSEGFKYNSQEVKNVTLYEFMDSVQRIQAIKLATAMRQGAYSGNIDVTKLDKKDLNWLRDLRE